MKKITSASLVAFLICFSACSNKAKSFIDNPTDAAITVMIDGKESITVQPNEYKEAIELDKGEHTMKVNDGQDIKFTVESGKVLLNPTLATYFVHKEIYTDNNALAEKEVEKMMEDGTFATSRTGAAINLDDVDFMINEDLPETVEMLQTETKKFKTKIFGEKQLVEYFKSMDFENINEILEVLKKGGSIKDMLNGSTAAETSEAPVAG